MNTLDTNVFAVNHAERRREQGWIYEYSPIGLELSRIKRNLIDVVIRWAFSQLVLCIKNSDWAPRYLLAEKNIYVNLDLEIGVKQRAVLGPKDNLWRPVDP